MKFFAEICQNLTTKVEITQNGYDNRHKSYTQESYTNLI